MQKPPVKQINSNACRGKKQRHAIVLLTLLALIVALCSLGLGQFHLPLQKILHILLAPVSDSSATFSVTEHNIVWTIRIPRVLMAFCAGSALALSGAALQGVFNNPLVDPHIIGVTSGAAFGGTLAILLGFSSWLLIVSTFSFGLLALLLVYAVAGFIGDGNRIILVLAGVILSGFFSALVSLVQYLSDTEETLPNIVFWLLGSFATANWHKFLIIFSVLLVVGGLLLRLRWHINLLSLGERQAQTLGISITRTRWLILILCALVVAAQVSVSGSIGWIGLVIPHLARFIVGPNHRYLLPASLLLGGTFMVVVDDVARTLTAAEIPVGILTALLGVPMFAIVLLKKYRRSL